MLKLRQQQGSRIAARCLLREVSLPLDAIEQTLHVLYASIFELSFNCTDHSSSLPLLLSSSFRFFPLLLLPPASFFPLIELDRGVDLVGLVGVSSPSFGLDPLTVMFNEI